MLNFLFLGEELDASCLGYELEYFLQILKIVELVF